MLEDYSLDLPFVPASHPVAIDFLHIEVSSIQPIFTLLFRLLAMDMDGLVCLIRVEKEAPPSDKERKGSNLLLASSSDGRHPFTEL